MPQGISMNLTKEQYFARCRNLAASEALEKLTEAIGSDRRADGPKIEQHLQVARDAVLDGLALAAETQS